MRPWWLMLWLASTGCDSVFGLHEIEPGRDQDDTAAPDAGASIDAGCSPTSAIVFASRDTYLDGNDPNGAATTLTLADQRTVILAFDLADATRVASATLRLATPAMARGCATGADACEPCPAPVGGQVTARWMRPDWDELATAETRDEFGRMWSGERAGGPIDRGVNPTTVTYTAGELLVGLARTPDDTRAEWMNTTGSVSLQITTDVARATFAAREADDCTTAAPPTLEVVCTLP